MPGSSAPTWPVVVRVFEGGWWDASQIYRSWVLAHGSWTKQGPMITRDDLPPWLYNLTTWVNSHWQQNDIFNISGGDPAVTANRVGAIAERADPAVAAGPAAAAAAGPRSPVLRLQIQLRPPRPPARRLAEDGRGGEVVARLASAAIHRNAAWG